MVSITTLRLNKTGMFCTQDSMGLGNRTRRSHASPGLRFHQQWSSSTQGCLQGRWVVSLDADLLSDVMNQDTWALQSRHTSDLTPCRPTPYHTTLRQCAYLRYLSSAQVRPPPHNRSSSHADLRNRGEFGESSPEMSERQLTKDTAPHCPSGLRPAADPMPFRRRSNSMRC
jgi:hypothetical protein